MMMMTPSCLTVPFFLDEQYLDFLSTCAGELDSLHIYLPHMYSGIYRREREYAAIPLILLQGLERLSGPAKYMILPQFMHELKPVDDQNNIRSILFLLEQCLERGQLHGIIYSDHYLLQCLADSAPPGLITRLEAIPSVNYGLDTVEKIEVQFAYIHYTGFKKPSRVALDRSLNRDLDRLADVCLRLHQRYPELKIEVLANEGCLFYCPYKLSPAACSTGFAGEERGEAASLSCQFGCARFLDEHPYKILQSPFIRPEDIDLYLYHVDAVRICGRTLGSRGIIPVIQAYRNRRHEGNLLSLLDSASWLANRFHIENSLLSLDFTSILSRCENRCYQCGFCKEVFESIAHPLFHPLEGQRLEN